MITGSTLGRVKAETAAAGLVLVAGAGWLAWPSLPPFILVLAVTAFVLSFIAPVWALALLALTAPFEQARATPWGVIYTSELFLVVFLPGFFWNIMRRPGWRRGLAPVAGWMLAFLLVLILTLGMHPSAITVKGTLRWLEFLLVMGAGVHLVRRGREAEQILWVLLASAVLSAGQGFWQFLSNAPDLSRIALTHGEVVRAAAGYGANTLAAFLALMLPFAMAAALFHPRGFARWLGILSAGVIMAGGLATFSLTGWLALTAAMATFLLLLSRTQPRWGLWIFILLLAGITGYAFFHPEFLAYKFWDAKLISWKNRLDYAVVVGQIWRTSPWLGIGSGMYRWVAPMYGTGDMNIIGLITHPHSLWLSLLAETGLLGLAAFLFGSFRATAWIWKRLPGLPAGWPTAAAWAMAAGCAGFAAANLTEHGLIHDRGAHAGLALAALLVLVKRPPRSWPPERKQLFNAAWDESPISLMPALAERLEHRAPLYALLEQALARGGSKILEMGCGPALDSLALAARPGWEVHAVDGSQRALALAESSARVLNRPLHLHHADVRRTGLAAASFDVIFSQGLWEHFPDPAPLWQEAVRLLKPGGMMVIDVPQGWNPYTLIKWGHQWLGDWPWGWETQYSLPGLKAWGRKYGLRTKAAAGYGYRGGTWDGTAALKNSMLRFAPKAWKQFEQRTGAWWMMNVVVLMEKTADDGKLKGVGARCAASLP